MANKKISQLMDSADLLNANNDYFALAERQSPGQYTTTKMTAGKVSEFVLNPVSATQISGLNKNVYLNNNNWINSTAGEPPNFGFLMIRSEDGLLTTGSGIGTPVDGDNLGNHTAIQPFNLNNQSTINANEIYFGGTATSNTLIQYDGDPGAKNLKFQAETDATLSGQRYVRISGQALHLANTPVSGDVTLSGNVTVSGGNLEIDPGNKLITNEITITKDPGFSSGTLSIEGASYHLTNSAPSNGGDIFWDYSNIQYCVCNNGSNATYDFNGVADGQTLTLYVQNPSNTAMTPSFTHTALVPVVWGSEMRDGSTYSNSPPILAPKKTNVYTFARINTGIFASAITGYVY